MEGEEESDEFLTGLTTKIKDLSKDFTARLSSRKKKLNNNLKLHEIMNRVSGFSRAAHFHLHLYRQLTGVLKESHFWLILILCLKILKTLIQLNGRQSC